DTDLQTVGPLAPTAADDGSLIDILVLYSTGVGTDVGTAVVEGYVDQFMAYTNLSYANSNIDQRVMLVGLEEVTYDDTGKDLNTTLGDVTIGNVPNAHTLRDTYHADLVVFLVRQTNPNSCAGLAWVQTVVSGAFEDTGYSTMNACSFGSGVFAHELGHNMGAQHDWYVNTNPNPYTYAHGHIDPTAGFRTIMSYSNKCNDLAVSCPRVAYFSNPNLTHSGAPMGIPGGTKSDCTLGSANSNTCDADVHLTFNNTAVNTSRFRPSGITWTGDTNTDWNNANNWEMPEGYNGNAGTVNRVPRQIDNVIIPSGAPRYPTLSSGNAYARELIIETGAQLTMNGGTLTVYGDWTEEGTGQFNGTAGTVIMGGALDQTITQNNPSNFHHLQLGDGSTQTIGLASNLDVNGDLTFNSGVRFEASNRTLRVGGDWQDDGNGFSADTSTVIFDGATQTANKITSTNLINEDFSEGDGGGCDCFSSKLPPGWIRESADGHGWLGGELTDSGEAIRWDNSPDAWLFTTAVRLSVGVTYQISYEYEHYFNGDTDVLTVYVGNNP
ncbi:MAG: hypothetical protein KDD89_13210, partial [Anaerolineales bacterium]|nr:hypothetical protein [Anaerolineales bacterium]